MALSLEQFRDRLIESGLMSESDIESGLVGVRAEDGEHLARALVKAGKLTAFQAQQLYAGRGQSLVVGNYVVLDRLGQGGMGVVVKARHRRMKRIVALKVLAAGVTKTPELLARFQREVEAAARLSHPNIVAAYDADVADGTPFLAMEYVEGQDLSTYVKTRGPLPVDAALDCLLQTARGLEYAHRHGVIHRDIKPGNLLLDTSGTVKILDMGLARIDDPTGEQAELTGTGAVMGTVDYMAPEQAESTRSADARSDIYSLGITLWYLLTGKAAYPGETLMSKLLAHREAPIPSLSAARSDVSPRLDALYQKMVAKKPSNRFQSAAEVIVALDSLRQGSVSLPVALPIGSSEDTRLSEFLAGLGSKSNRPLGSSASATPVDGTPDETVVVPRGSSAGPVPALPGSDASHTLPMARSRRSTPPLWKDRRLQLGGGLTLAILAAMPFLWPRPTPPVVKAGNPTKLTETTSTHATAVGLSELAQAGDPAEPVPPPAVAPFDAKQALAHQEAWSRRLNTTVETTNAIGMRMVLIPPGEFRMGSSDEQVESAVEMATRNKEKEPTKEWIRTHERPQRRTVISQAYAMGATEVTVGQFKQFVEATKYVTAPERLNEYWAKRPAKSERRDVSTWREPGYPLRDDLAVTALSWNDMCEFCNWLSERHGLTPWYVPEGDQGFTSVPRATGYRLPTEAEWEHACRAGTTTHFWFGDDDEQLADHAWWRGNSGGPDGRTQAVAAKRANPFGLFDMHGNVLEWCHQDFAQALPENPHSADLPRLTPNVHRTARGGDWSMSPVACRSAYRFDGYPAHWSNRRGFRCVRPVFKVDPPPPARAP